MKVKIKKTKGKKELRTEVIAGVIAAVLGIGRIFCALFVTATSTQYTIEIQKAENEIEAIKEANNNLSIEIQTLQNKDRVYTIAQESGLTQNQANVISIN